MKIKSFVSGFITACFLGLGGIGCFLYLGTGNSIPLFHDQVLLSGKRIKVTSCNFVWGSEHSDRFPDKDCFALEYVSSMPNSDRQTSDRETLEVFELIRPVSELWGLDKAEIHAFPSTKRKGAYGIYLFTRNSDGKWTFDQHSQKVHIND